MENQDKYSILREYFGYREFRGGQAEIIDALTAGRDVLCVMPTGGGKSLCYQIPAMLFPGVTLVISPLISLMQDQVRSLTRAGIRAAYINSSLTPRQYAQVLDLAAAGEYKILYVAPERLSVPEFLAVCAEMEISLIAVDEAHCVSQWGQDFRPHYLRISEFVGSLPRRPVVGAFTATATETVRQDVTRALQLRDPLEITTGFDRPNLYFGVRKVRPRHKNEELLSILAGRGEQSGIVYCATRKAVEEVADFLTEQGIPAARYHAGLPDEERRQSQEAFVCDRIPVMVATNAFGMGIDKSNVSYVIHYHMPKDLESYYQEAGRAGRDGEAADCILFYTPGDVRLAQFLIENSEPNPELTSEQAEAVRENDRQRLKHMTFYCTTAGCLRSFLLKYFGDSAPEYCGNCSGCAAGFTERDVTVDAQKILSTVVRSGQRYGARIIIDTLLGSDRERILALGMQNLTTYGLMKDSSGPYIRQVIDRLLYQGALVSDGGALPILRLGDAARPILRGECTVTMMEAPVKKTEPKENKKRRSRTEEDVGLYAALKTLRQSLAAEEKVPAYVIFTNASLADMAIRVPRTKAEMLEVSGVGKKKLERYGDLFLAAIDEYLRGEGTV